MCLPAVAAGTLAARDSRGLQDVAFDARARERLVLAFASNDRTDWHYTPRSRVGVPFADMDTKQRDAVHHLAGRPPERGAA